MTGNAAEREREGGRGRERGRGWEREGGRGREGASDRFMGEHCAASKGKQSTMEYKSEANRAGLGRVHMRSCTAGQGVHIFKSSVACIREDWGWLPAGAHHTPVCDTLPHKSLLLRLSALSCILN